MRSAREVAGEIVDHITLPQYPEEGLWSYGDVASAIRADRRAAKLEVLREAEEDVGGRLDVAGAWIRARIKKLEAEND